METAGKMVEDETLREALKQRGLGTPSTRAAIIETLLKRGYIERKKKTLVATANGRYLITLVQNPNLKSPELTGIWESKLKEIEHGGLDSNQFMNEIYGYTKELIETSNLTEIDPNQLGPCPLCNSSVIQGKKGFGCSQWKKGCTFVLWREYKGVTLSTNHIQKLLQKRVILSPVNVPELGNVILTLSDSGIVKEQPVPNEAPAFKKRYPKKAYSKRRQ